MRPYILLTALLLTACTATPTPKPRSTADARQIRITHLPQQAAGHELVLHSMSLVGTPYRWGGSSTGGFDCSGLVQYVYRQAVNVPLPRTAREMAAASRTIPTSRLASGDLVFFNTAGNGISHVGLYVGNGQFLHAPRRGSTVRLDSLQQGYYAQRLVKAGSFF